MTQPLSPPAPSFPASLESQAIPGGRRFAALRSANFMRLWLGLVVSNVGSQMQLAALGWLVRDLHAEPFYLGLLSLSSALPMILVTPFGGAIADWVPRIRLLTFTQLGMLLQAVLLALLTLAGLIQFWEIMALQLAGAVLLALDSPARQALLPDVVSRDELASAIPLFSAAWAGSALFGPALAGLLLVPVGAGGLFLLNAVSFLAVVYALWAMRNAVKDAPGRGGSIVGGVVDGARYARRDPLVLTVLLLMACGSLLGRSYLILMPIFARDVLGQGPESYGLMLAAPGAGALIAGAGLAAMRSIRRKDVMLLGALFTFVALLLAFTLSRSLPLSLVLLLASGVMTTTFSASATTMLQLHAPRHLRGRVMSFATIANIGLSNLGGTTSGVLATFVGAPLAVAIGATTLAGIGAVAATRRDWRRIARSEPGTRSLA